MVDPGSTRYLQDLFCSSLCCDFAFHILRQEKRRQKGKKGKEKKGRNNFPLGGPSAIACPSAGVFLDIMCIKKLI
jgi:hypothetical protein